MHRRRFIALLAAAITAARTLRAQQKAMPVIGWLDAGSAGMLQTPEAREGIASFLEKRKPGWYPKS